MTLKKIFCASALSLMLGVSVPASAILVDDTGDDFSISWVLPNAGGSGITLQASAFFDVVGVSDTSLALSVTVNNISDSGAPSGYVGDVASIGFATDPNAMSASYSPAGATFDGLSFDDIPSLSLVELCAWAGNNCNGGGHPDLLWDGNSDVFGLTLASLSDGSSTWSLTDFGIKFQGDIGSFEFYGCENDCREIPEPATVLLLGAGLAMLGFLRRRKLR